MKFKIGDETDTALCVALKHEFLRCHDAFNDFAESGELMINQEQLEANGQTTLSVDQRRRIAFKTYNAYARFLHHLYEFLMGCVARDRQDTKQLDYELADRYVGGSLQRALTKRRTAILNGTAPSWENHISYFPENIPSDLPKSFRRFRNIVSGHVKIERSRLSLTDFYDQNHKFLYMLYRDAQNWWGRPSDEFPDLNEVTAFSVLIKTKILPLFKLRHQPNIAARNLQMIKDIIISRRDVPAIQRACGKLGLRYFIRLAVGRL